ncbi:hypothetical protein OKA06_02130 [Novosphingobium sp. MW5]|nr:hypothetical protein [Novosphingobium sp. MW5]
MIAQTAQILVSLAAIFALAWLAGRMGLGGDVRLRDEGEAKELAQAALCGFEPVDTVLDRAGIGALIRGADGRIVLLRRHGVHFAARVLTSHEGSRLDRNFLTISTGERTFGTVTLDLGKRAQEWAGSLRRLGGAA